jgi:hypothetical protein
VLSGDTGGTAFSLALLIEESALQKGEKEVLATFFK